MLRSTRVHLTQNYTLANKLYTELGETIANCLPKHIQSFSVYKDELTIHIAPCSSIPVFRFLRDHQSTQFKLCMDVCGVDYPSRENRFEVVYHLLSICYNTRIRVKTYANEVQGVHSISSLYPAANWFEREAWDMYYYLI